MTLGLLPNFDNTGALRYFYKVARYGSFRLAAAKIHIAASAISRQVHLLAQELGPSYFPTNAAVCNLRLPARPFSIESRKQCSQYALLKLH